MSIQVKICGITSLNSAMDAVELGADCLGFHFCPDSIRFTSFDILKNIFSELPYSICKIGVFVNADEQFVIDLATEFELDYLQFDGDEKPEYCNQFSRPFIKSIMPRKESEIEGLDQYQPECYLVKSFVQNTADGHGVVNNWDLAKLVQKKYGKIMLSGGLNPANIEMAVRAVKPYGVNIMEGIESPDGQKDYHLMEEIIKKVKNASRD